MKAVKQNKTIHYKSAKFVDNNITLQSLLEKAFDKKSAYAKAVARKEQFNPDSAACRLISRFRVINGVFFGQLAYFESGKVPLKLLMNDDSEQCEIIATNDKSENDSTTEFPESLLYFCVLDNHVAVIQSKSLGFKDLEYHLNWFLNNCCNYITSALILSDQVLPEVREKLYKEPAKELVYEEPLYTNDMLEKKPENSQGISQAEFNLDGSGASILKNLFNFKGIKLNESLDDANLFVQVIVKYKNRTSESGQKVLDSIASSMRHNPDENFKIRLKNGGIISGKDLRISGKIPVSILNGVIDENGISLEMINWLSDQAQKVV
ncbi:hypothetical protein [Acinetobacter nosocomialis]|uniref:hypothetical protein n=1 Tax=Acinetobacter nosocomialis TaxID=106654 RepID=UPI001B830D44|nr:hypothetical protein [Acinetobacter nosocomialis]MBR7773333.1 hypothetical protein [Acinetobacter nosocomialis]